MSLHFEEAANSHSFFRQIGYEALLLLFALRCKMAEETMLYTLIHPFPPLDQFFTSIYFICQHTIMRNAMKTHENTYSVKKYPVRQI